MENHRLKAYFIFLMTMLICGSPFTINLSAQSKTKKPRVIVTTDGERDDRCSMVRFLLYSNEYDIEGLIYSSSKYHWVGYGNWAGEKWIQRDIGLYAEVYQNLIIHDPDFPSPQALLDVIRVGNIDSVGQMDKDSPGSDKIVEILLDNEPGPVYLQAWGGANTIARALYKIQNDFPDQMKKVSQKAVLYLVFEQDSTLRNYILPNWPDMTIILNKEQFQAIAYRWDQYLPSQMLSSFDSTWMRNNILKAHGSLCARYETRKDNSFVSEGDSPAFMHQIVTGLRNLENPSYGGWGGRFKKDKKFSNLWVDEKDDNNPLKPIWRWAETFQNDWAARADWCVKSLSDANHNPVVRVGQKADIRINPGETIKLNANKSFDPDGDNLLFHWWIYSCPGTFKGKIDISNEYSNKISVRIPEEAKSGDNIHIICEVSDDGKPALTRYKRIIIHLK